MTLTKMNWRSGTVGSPLIAEARYADMVSAAAPPKNSFVCRTMLPISTPQARNDSTYSKMPRPLVTTDTSS